MADRVVARVPPDALRAFCVEALRRCEVSRADAAIVADSLVDADRRAVYSHGVVRLRDYVHRLRTGAMKPDARLRQVAGRAPFTVVDGGNGLGQVASRAAMRRAIGYAAKQGIGAVGVRRSNHFGCAGYYSRMAAREGMVGLAFTNSSPVLAPWGGRDVVLGNNPWSIAVPRAGGDVVLDLANSVAARGKIRAAAAAGEKIPLGWALDREGTPTADPRAALEGIILPIGEYKGYGIAFMVDVLAGVLTGAAFADDVGSPRDAAGEANVGHLFVALDIRRVMRPVEFEKRMGALVARMKSARRWDGTAEIYVPGEIEIKKQAANEASVPLFEDAVTSLRTVAKDVGVALPAGVGSERPF